MTLSELIEKVGSDHVQFQKLDESMTNISKAKKGVKITFQTHLLTLNEVATDEWRNVCLIVWLPKERVKSALNKEG